MDRWNALSRRGKIIVGAVGLLFACAICNNILLGGGADQPTGGGSSDVSAPSDRSDKLVPTPTRELLVVGNIALVGNETWILQAARDHGSEYGQATTKGRFVAVFLRIRNDGDDSTRILPPVLIDNREREFKHSSDAQWEIDQEYRCVLERVNPGIERECLWVYEVPKVSSGLLLEVSSGLFGERRRFDLGLR